MTGGLRRDDNFTESLQQPSPSPGPPAQPISAPAFPAASSPGNRAARRADTCGCTPDSAANVKPGHAPERAPEPRQAGTPTVPPVFLLWPATSGCWLAAFVTGVLLCPGNADGDGAVRVVRQQDGAAVPGEADLL